MLAEKDFNQLRQTGDEPADLVIQQLVEQTGRAFLRPLMSYLADYQQLNYDSQPAILQDFFVKNQSFPDFYNKKNTYRATQFYRKYKESIGIVLTCYSLPYCYLGADGAKVLCQTNRIKDDTYRRLLETGKFVNAVMNQDNWENGQVLTIITKVRLMHAVVRWFSLNSANAVWDKSWGIPVNQEDMSGTNASFSFIVLRGLRKMGYQLDESDEKAYLATWNVIGYLLGLWEELLPQTWKEAYTLEKIIVRRQVRASEEGKILTKSLLNCYQKMAGNELMGKFFTTQTRFLLGNEYADMLGVPPPEINPTILKMYNSANSILTEIF